MVYFVKQGDYVKIGCSNLFKKRLIQLQTLSPVKLEVLALIKGDKSDEQKIHNLFKHINTSGEWFLYNDEIEKFVDGLDKDLMWKYGFVENNNSPIGLIKQTRLQLNLSLEELGEKLGVTKQAVMDMERRDVQGRITTRAIHKALNAMGFKYEARVIKVD